jgi:hypothetical protein
MVVKARQKSDYNRDFARYTLISLFSMRQHMLKALALMAYSSKA